MKTASIIPCCKTCCQGSSTMAPLTLLFRQLETQLDGDGRPKIPSTTIIVFYLSIVRYRGRQWQDMAAMNLRMRFRPLTDITPLFLGL